MTEIQTVGVIMNELPKHLHFDPLVIITQELFDSPAWIKTINGDDTRIVMVGSLAVATLKFKKSNFNFKGEKP